MAQRVRLLSLISASLLALPGCSSLSIEAAQKLAVTGREVATQSKSNTSVSDDEIRASRDAEALFHGASGTENSPLYAELKTNYEQANEELAKRAAVFDQLVDVYSSFGELAGITAAKDTEAALGGLTGAVNDYAKQLGKEPPITDDATNVITAIGGLFAEEVQKSQLEAASAGIRTRLTKFHELLSSPLVRTQLTGYRKVLLMNAAAAYQWLWKQDAYSATPILTELGERGGLAFDPNAKLDPKLKAAAGKVMTERLSHKAALVDEGYEASVEGVARLIAEHEKLEAGAPLDLTRLRGIAAELKQLVDLLNKANGAATAP